MKIKSEKRLRKEILGEFDSYIKDKKIKKMKIQIEEIIQKKITDHQIMRILKTFNDYNETK